jgi:hypothetical protein
MPHFAILSSIPACAAAVLTFDHEVYQTGVENSAYNGNALTDQRMMRIADDDN